MRWSDQCSSALLRNLGTEVRIIGSDNWVVQNLENALEVWNGKLSEDMAAHYAIPAGLQRGGAIWTVIEDIHGALQAIGYALLVLFFVVGVVKTCGSFVEVKNRNTR